VITGDGDVVYVVGGAAPWSWLYDSKNHLQAQRIAFVQIKIFWNSDPVVRDLKHYGLFDLLCGLIAIHHRHTHVHPKSRAAIPGKLADLVDHF